MLARTFRLKKQFSLKLSQVAGGEPFPLLTKTISQQLRETQSKYPDRPAVYSLHEDRALDYTQLLERVEKTAAGLLSLNLEHKHARVGIYAPNLIDYYVAQLACSMADLTMVNINPGYRQHELKYALDKVQCEVVLMTSEIKTSQYDDLLLGIAPEFKDGKPGEVECEGLQNLKYVFKFDDNTAPAQGYLGFSDLVEQGNNDDKLSEMRAKETLIDTHDITNIQFTSGTTGNPKAATLTHHGILNNGMLLAERMRFTPEDKICCSVPLYHCFGVVMANLACLTAGAEVLYAAPVFDAEACVDVITQKKATTIYGVPTMFFDFVKLAKENPGKYDFSSAVKGVTAGAICPPQLMKDVIKYLGLEGLSIGYGMTETSPVSFLCKMDDTFEQKTETVGCIYPHIEAKIVDENDEVVPIGETGEIVTAGHCVMKGYWEDEEGTNKAIKDGWMYTGDLGVMDKDGYLQVVGRSKDMIIRGGENVSPRAIEDKILEFDEVEFVQVFGVPDERLGEEIFAWVKHAKGAELTKEELFERTSEILGYFQVPKYVKFVDEFPITVTGKPQKFKMADAMIEERDQAENGWEQYQVR